MHKYISITIDPPININYIIEVAQYYILLKDKNIILIVVGNITDSAGSTINTKLKITRHCQAHLSSAHFRMMH